MQFILPLVFTLPLFNAASEQVVAPVKPAVDRRIDPEGIVGTLILTGSEPSPQAIERFLAAVAKGKSARILVVTSGLARDDWAKQLKDRKLEGKILTAEDTKTFAAEVGSAQGVWLELNGPAASQFFAKRARTSSLADLLHRGGVLGTSGEVATWLGKVRKNGSESGIGILEGSLVGPPEAKVSEPSGLVCFELERDSALEISGRTIRSVGANPVTIRLARSKTWPARAIMLKGKAMEDLVTLQRAARDRAAEQSKLGEPVLEKGALVIVGGGGYPAGLMERFVQLAGGEKSNIVILPTANPDPLPKQTGLENAFRKAGAGKVTTLPGRTLAEVEGPASLDALRNATGIWFGGGRQWRFVDAYEGTKAHELMKEVLKRGGVIGGTSAGATIQGEYLCRGGVFENFTMMYEGYERGLGFLPGVAIDQHFSQRKRFGDMSDLMRMRRDLLGIGIDETTAIIVQGSVAEVTGKGRAFFYDPLALREHDGLDYEAVAAGECYDLKSRKRLKRKGD